MACSSENEVARICQHLQHLAGNYRRTYTEQQGENAGQMDVSLPCPDQRKGSDRTTLEGSWYPVRVNPLCLAMYQLACDQQWEKELQQIGHGGRLRASIGSVWKQK